MKRILNKYTLFFVIVLIAMLFIPSKAHAVSYESDYVKLKSMAEFETAEFEINLEYTVFLNDPSKKSPSITGYAKRKMDKIYYYHYIIYYYDINKQEIGATDGYNGMWKKNTSFDGSYIESLLEQKNMYNNYKISDIRYYKVFIEPATKEIVHDYLYNNHSKLNENGLDKITDFNTIFMETTRFKDKTKINGYVIDEYKIDMVVNEDNSFDITETITADFDESKHGIFRKIPLKNSIARLDGTKSKNTAQISNIRVNENYTTYNENGYKVIKIGNANITFTGKKTYIIKYTYNIGKDPLKNADELYFNLIGNEWDTNINNISFKITMPKSFDESLLGFSSGQTTSTNSSNVKYNVIENTINGSLNDTLAPGEALTVRLTLPDKYFVGAGLKLDKSSLFIMLTCLACVFIAFILWAIYGKDEKVVETVEFYPPEGYNSAEVGFLYKGIATNKSIISLLIYLANKGYLKIKETEGKGAFFKSKGFKIIKQKEYDGDNEYEKLFFKGLFGRNKRTVTNTDLYDKFYITLNKIESKLNSKENKHKIFKSTSSGKGILLILMIIAIFVLITIRPILEYSEGGINTLPVALLFPGIGFALVFLFAFRASGVEKIVGMIAGCIFGGGPWVYLILPCLLQNTIHLITYIIGIVCISLIIIFIKIMPKRTPFGIEILGKIRGFKRFLETAEKPQLESFVMHNPEYFYNILPYTYALGVSDVWIKQFESISLEAPRWYDSHDHFNTHSFGDIMNSVSNAMSSSTSSSDSSGNSSGGGSSGGGSGGGGGGSW